MYEVYTDGSCLGNPGRGGWAVVGDDFKLSGKQPNTTNNAMEMTAVLKALEECLERDIQEVCIFTDSQYVKNGISSWIVNWKKNDWVTSTGTQVKNKELWIAIDEVRNKLKVVEWKWVKAHNGHPKNEEVDTLAYEAAGGTVKTKTVSATTKTKTVKFYGVVRGHIPGIYTTWDEAKTQIDGYPGAIYKSFKTQSEADEYMNTPVKEYIYLNVPFSDKDRVKSLGAKWDPVEKKWWVQEMKPELENYLCYS
jgi:ribonuclease HI